MKNEQTEGKPLFALELNYVRKIFKFLFSVHSKNGKMSGFRLLFTFLMENLLNFLFKFLREIILKCCPNYFLAEPSITENYFKLIFLQSKTIFL